jgi:type IV pilus assembly protein PilC
MSTFVFKAKRSNGEIYKGERDAKDRFDLYKMLKESGDEAISVKEKSGGFSFNINFNFFNSIKMMDKITFSKNLGSMISAGLAISRALSVMENQNKNKKVKKIIGSLRDEISSGKTLSESMEMYKNMFSPLVISMVKAGEQSGMLAEALKVVSTQMEKSYQLQKRIKGALMYPSVVLAAMVIIGIIMLTYIVPTLMKTFKELNLALPTPTKIVLFISDMIINNGIFILIVIVILGCLAYFWSKSLNGKNILHYIIIKIPVIGNLVKEVNSARTARSMSSLITSGVDVLEALRITKDIVQNVHYKKVIEQSAQAVEKGDLISKVFHSNEKLYPSFFSEMIEVGEETGKIGEMLLGVAVYYEEDVDQRTKDMSTIIEPVLMVFIAVGVGFFAIAMISPMYSLVNAI